MELIIKELQKLPDIDFNFEELKAELQASVKKYETIVYTSKNIKKAKNDRAKLNSLFKAINNRKIQVKKEYMQSYIEFEDKIKELLALIDKPILVIDRQIKHYETEAKQEKKKKIEQIFEQLTGSLKDIINVADVFDDRWLNVTYPMSEIEEEIKEFIGKVKVGLSLICTFDEEFQFQCKAAFLKEFNMQDALDEKLRLEKLKSLQNKNTIGLEQQQEIQNEEGQFKHKLPLTIVDFRVWATSEQLQKLKVFLRENNIKYGKVGN